MFLAAGAFVLADVWHQYTLGQRVSELREIIAQVERDVQGGVPARDWHESRIKGSNGWRHVAFLWDAAAAVRELEEDHREYEARRSAQGKTWYALKQLQAYFNGEWEEKPEDQPDNFVPRKTPTRDELEALLFATRMMPESTQLAADCDVVTPILDSKQVTDTWGQSISPFTSGTIALAMLGRVMALRELGKTEEAEKELLVSARFWSKYRLPLNFTDGAWFAVGKAKACLIYAEELLSQGALSVTTAAAIVELDFDGDFLLVEAIKADVVWICLQMQREPNLLQDPRWFEWMSREKSTLQGYELPNYAYGFRAEECGRCRDGLLHDIRSINQLRDPRPWADIRQTAPPGENYYGLVAETLPHHSVSFRQLNVRWLALKLRLMEKEIGPLAEHRAQAEALIAEHTFARHEWAGGTLLLYAVPIIGFPPDDRPSNYPDVELAPAK
jgi:hypothetical protein